jgi:hypothetical protein
VAEERARIKARVKGERKKIAHEVGTHGGIGPLDYEDYTISGPAVFQLDRSVSFEGDNSLLDVSFDEAFTQRDEPLHGAIPLHDVTFRNCWFESVGFVGPEETIAAARRRFKPQATG